MTYIVAVLVLLIGVVIAIVIAWKRAEQQRAAHDARLRAMAQVYLSAAKKKAAAKQGAAAAAPEAAAAVFPVREERECPFCAEPILKKARVCKHCGRDVQPLA